MLWFVCCLGCLRSRRRWHLSSPVTLVGKQLAVCVDDNETEVIHQQVVFYYAVCGCWSDYRTVDTSHLSPSVISAWITHVPWLIRPIWGYLTARLLTFAANVRRYITFIGNLFPWQQFWHCPIFAPISPVLTWQFGTDCVCGGCVSNPAGLDESGQIYPSA